MNEKALDRELGERGIKENPYFEIYKGIVRALYQQPHVANAKFLDIVEIFKEVDKSVLEKLGEEAYGGRYTETMRMALVSSAVDSLNGNMIKQEGCKYRLKGRFRSELR